MGSLVFQATLGGQVNLNGPNTASTFDIAVPATTGTMVTTGDSGTVTNTMLAASAYNTPGTIGSGTANTGAFTTLSASSTVSGTGFSTYLASPPAIGGTTAASGRFSSLTNTGLTSGRVVYSTTSGLETDSANLTFDGTTLTAAGLAGPLNGTVGATTPSTASFTSLAYSTTLTGGTGIVNLGSGQFYKDASGNVGIGSTSPTNKLQVLTNGTSYQIRATGDGSGAGYVAYSNSEAFACGVGGTTGGGFGVGLGFVGTLTNQPLLIVTNGTEKARIDSSGNVSIGTTSNTDPTRGIAININSGSSYQDIGHVTGTASGTRYMGYFYNGSLTGNITQNGTTAVAYNTSSDYRLKENITPMTGALAKVAALKPCTYTWKSAPEEVGEGFIAHELAEVCPHAVTGTKDAVDEDGNPKYQGIDTSFLVATLTAAIQELKAEFDAYKAVHP